MEKKDKVSVVITSFNRGDLLKRAIESVLNQTHNTIELIVVDDNSSDKLTLNYLKYFERNFENIIVIYNTENKGANYSRNLGIKSATGYYYTGLDDDDYFEPNRIEFLLNNYDDRFSFICDNYLVKDSQSTKARFLFSRKLGYSSLLYVNLAGNQVFTTIEKMHGAGLFDENLKRLQDHDMWLRLIYHYGSAYRFNVNTYIMDISHDGIRITNNNKAYNSYFDFYQKHSSKMNFYYKIKNINRLDFYKNEPNYLSLIFSPKLLIKTILGLK